jgi:hypothetical protein
MNRNGNRGLVTVLFRFLALLHVLRLRDVRNRSGSAVYDREDAERSIGAVRRQLQFSAALFARSSP